MRSIFLKPNLMATLIAVAVMSAVNYFHGTPNPLVTGVIAGLIFFAIFSGFMAWMNRTPRD